jgi:hypothetical protein
MSIAVCQITGRSELADFKNQFALQMTRFADPVRLSGWAAKYQEHISFLRIIVYHFSFLA